MFDIRKDVCAAFAMEFYQDPDVSVLHCSLDDLPAHDFIVTPGNSPAIQDDIQNYILYNREPIRIGECVTWHSGDTGPHKNIIYAPTMKSPGGVMRVANVFEAVVAALCQWGGMGSIAIPGMGTGAGSLNPLVAASTIKQAIKFALSLID